MTSSTSTTNPYKLYIDSTKNLNSNMTYPSTALGTTTDLKWNQKELKVLAKVGFKYNKKTSCWELDLTATISILSEDISEYINHHKPCDEAIINIKRLKEKLIKKLTAKMILIELSKPREIKE